MCGIGGFVPSRNVNTTSVKRLWRAIQDRGKHASGLAYLPTGTQQIEIAKGAVNSSEAIEQGTIAHMGSEIDWVMLHTRFTTQGSTSNNNNNHPVCRDEIILTHNGVIYNDQEVFDRLAIDGVFRKYDVDTEAIAAGLAHRGIEWVASEIRGSMSLAWVDTTKPSQVNWFTNGQNPLVIGRLQDGGIVWASQPHHLEDLPVRDWFWAKPFKHYWTTGSGQIQSRWVSDEREPACTWQSGHAASRTVVSTPVKKVVATTEPQTHSTLIKGGWIYDEDMMGWRKARKADFHAELFDDDGRLF